MVGDDGLITSCIDDLLSSNLCPVVVGVTGKVKEKLNSVQV